MNDIIEEACAVAEDLKDVIIVGAVAVMLQTGRSRTSHDIDMVLAAAVSRERLLELGYIPVSKKRDSWDSPRGAKIDIYRHDVGGIPVPDIVKTATTISKNAKREMRVGCLEFLIVAKYRAFNSAHRPNDGDDLQTIVRKRLKKIDWNRLKGFCRDEVEYGEIIKMLKDIKKLG